MQNHEQTTSFLLAKYLKSILLVRRSGFCLAPAARPPLTPPTTDIPPLFTPPSGPANVNGLDLFDKPMDWIKPLSVPMSGGFDCPKGYTKFCCDSKVNPNNGKALGCKHCTLSSLLKLLPAFD